MTQTTDALQKFTKARGDFIFHEPFYATLSLNLSLKEDICIPTACVNGHRIAFNPEFINGLSQKEVQFVLAHEVMHCVLLHHTRRGTRDPIKWNVAADFVVNLMLKQQGFTLWQEALIDTKYQGMTTEQVYNELPDPPLQGGGGDGQGESGCYDKPGPGDVEDFPGDKPTDGLGNKASQDEMESESREWQTATIQAAQGAKVQGKLPAGLERLIEDITTPKQNWRDLLSRFVVANFKSDYKWSKPNRRFVSQGLYLPSQDSQDALERVVIAVDTSGSVGQSEIDEFASEMTSILEDFKTTITVIYCDSEVYKDSVQEISSDELPLELTPKGGGGTDFKPPFEYVEEQELRPACLIYFTDLECSSFPDEPWYPVLWLHTNGWGGGTEPPFGEVVEMD